MKNKLFLVFWILILSSFLIYGIFIQDAPTFSPDSSSEISEGCNVLQENGNGINILFFSGRDIAKDYLDYFLESPPFDEATDNFNFFYIEDKIPKCELYDGDVFYCYSRELVKESSVCPNDYIVVFGDYPENIRSSAFMNVLSINSNHPKSVFLHEFGHVFANFAEEYVDENAKIPSKAKNCVSSCNDFGEGSECFEGCTKSNYYRSSFESVMRTLNTRDYGFLNNEFILKRIGDEVINSNFITGNVVSSKDYSCSNSKYYLVESSSREVSKSVHTGCPGTPGYGDTGYYMVLAGDNSVFSKGGYNRKFIFTTAPSSDGELSGGTYEAKVKVYLKIPVSKIIEGAEIRSTDLAILTEKNKYLFKMKVGDELSRDDVKKFGKTDSRYSEERRVVVREDKPDNPSKEKEEKKTTERVSRENDPVVHKTLFSLISNLFSNFANFLFSEEITGNVVEERIIDEPFEKLD